LKIQGKDEHKSILLGTDQNFCHWKWKNWTLSYNNISGDIKKTATHFCNDPGLAGSNVNDQDDWIEKKKTQVVWGVHVQTFQIYMKQMNATAQ